MLRVASLAEAVGAEAKEACAKQYVVGQYGDDYCKSVMHLLEHQSCDGVCPSWKDDKQYQGRRDGRYTYPNPVKWKSILWVIIPCDQVNSVDGPQDGSTASPPPPPQTCDWQLVHRQSISKDSSCQPTTDQTAFLFPKDTLTTTSINADNPSACQFSLLNQMESFRGRDNKFFFKMKWPNYAGPANHQIWKQVLNPVTGQLHPVNTRGTYTVDSLGESEDFDMAHGDPRMGYEPVDVNFINNYWYGLQRTNHAWTLLKGAAYENQIWYSIGVNTLWKGGIAGPCLRYASYSVYDRGCRQEYGRVHATELYACVEASPSLPPPIQPQEELS